MRYLGLLISSVLLALWSCDSEEVEVPSSQNYFPTAQGHYVDYEVDSIFHDVPSGIQDTSHFFVREQVDSTFLDNDGRPSQQLLRFYRADTTEAWQLRDVWVITRTNQRAEKVEENQRIVKLSFPAIIEDTWDGNAFNTLDEWEYMYTDVDVPRTIAGNNYSETARVLQRNRVNLIERENAEEIYARNVGLVYKHIDTLKFAFDGQSQYILQTGVEYEMKAIDWGIIE